MRTTKTARRAINLVTISAAATLLAACGGTAGGEGGNEGDGAAPDEDVTLTWWAWNVVAAEDMVAAFEDENPGITVEFRPYAFDDYSQALRPALTSDDGPDVFQLQPGGMLQNYEPLATDLAPLLADSLGEDWQSDFYELGLEQLAVGDKQAALPSVMSAAGTFYYNQSILDEAAVEVPTTFSDWEQACPAITALGYQCLAHGAMDAWVNLDVFLSIINSDEPGLVYEAIEGETPWDSPELVTATEEFLSLFETGIIPEGAAARAEYPDAFNDFVAGNAAFIALGTFNTPGTMTTTGLATSAEGISGEPSGPFFAVPFPAAQDGNEPTQLFGGPDNGWAVSAQSEHPEEAYQLLEFLSHGGGQEIQAAQGNIPGNSGVPVSTDDVVVPEQAENVEWQQEAFGDLVGARQIPYPDLEAALGQALSAVIAGTQDPAAAMAAVEQVSAGLARSR